MKTKTVVFFFFFMLLFGIKCFFYTLVLNEREVLNPGDALG